MNFPPYALAALLTGPILGIAASGTINTVPNQTGSDLLASIPRHASSDYEADELANSLNLPDHYPLVTPRGVVPVADLMTHGLYSNRRFRRVYYAFDDEIPEPAKEIPAVSTRPEPGPVFQQDIPAEDAMPVLAVQTEQGTGRARYIDVKAALSSN